MHIHRSKSLLKPAMYRRVYSLKKNHRKSTIFTRTHRASIFSKARRHTKDRPDLLLVPHNQDLYLYTNHTRSRIPQICTEFSCLRKRNEKKSKHTFVKIIISGISFLMTAMTVYLFPTNWASPTLFLAGLFFIYLFRLFPHNPFRLVVQSSSVIAFTLSATSLFNGLASLVSVAFLTTAYLSIKNIAQDIINKSHTALTYDFHRQWWPKLRELQSDLSYLLEWLDLIAVSNPFYSNLYEELLKIRSDLGRIYTIFREDKLPEVNSPADRGLEKITFDEIYIHRSFEEAIEDLEIMGKQILLIELKITLMRQLHEAQKAQASVLFSWIENTLYNLNPQPTPLAFNNAHKLITIWHRIISNPKGFNDAWGNIHFPQIMGSSVSAQKIQELIDFTVEKTQSAIYD